MLFLEYEFNMSKETKTENLTLDKQLNELSKETVEEINDSFEEVNPKLSITYDIKNTEEEEAFITFQKKFIVKSSIIKTIAFGVLALMFIYQIIKAPDNFASWLCLVVCLAVIFIVWYNPFKIRKTLMESLKPLENDRYIFKLYENRFSIGTIISQEEIDEAIKEGEEPPQIPPKIVSFSDTGLSVLEKENMFVIFLKKESIYVLPKRCMTDSEIKELSFVFDQKLGDDFETENVNIKNL